jgi:MFS family permease
MEDGTRSQRRRSLLRHRDFLMIWSATTVSICGSQITLIAVPFIALTMLGATVFEVSLLAAVEMTPFLLFTLPAGAWLDRVRRRPVLIGADIVRGVVLLSVPAAYLGGSLSLAQLFVVAFVTGSATAFFDVAGQSYLPAILDREDLVEGNARLQISYSIAQIGGPTLAGSLIALIAAPLAIAVDALSFFLSGGFLSAIHRREVSPARRLNTTGRPEPMHREIREGLEFVLGNRLLRPIAACTGISNLFAAALFGVFPVLIWNELRLPPAFYGSVMGAASFGFLAGAGMSDRLPRRIGVGPTIVLSATLGAPAFLLMALTPPSLTWAAVTLGAGWFVAGMSQVLYNVSQLSLRQAITPPELQSRMNATMRFIVWGTIPIGFVAGGILATVLPTRAALVLAALACGTSCLPVVFSPLRGLIEMPAIQSAGARRTARPEESRPAGTSEAGPEAGAGRGLSRPDAAAYRSQQLTFMPPSATCSIEPDRSPLIESPSASATPGANSAISAATLPKSG